MAGALGLEVRDRVAPCSGGEDKAVGVGTAFEDIVAYATVERVATGIVFIWGIVMMATAGCTGYAGYVRSSALGISEKRADDRFQVLCAKILPRYG